MNGEVVGIPTTASGEQGCCDNDRKHSLKNTRKPRGDIKALRSVVLGRRFRYRHTALSFRQGWR